MSIFLEGVTLSSLIIGVGSAAGIEVNFSEFSPSGLTPGQDIEDSTGSFNPPIGITINNGADSGVAITNLTTSNLAAFAANPNNNGYIWNVTWGAGSTYTTTPVALYFALGGIVFWILNPSNPSVGASGTFNFPAYFTSTTVPTLFEE